MWGRNSHGQCGIGIASTKVLTPKYVKQPWSDNLSVDDFSCGQGHAMCVVAGEVYVWGSGENGQLGTHQVLSLEPEAIESIRFCDRNGMPASVVRVCAGPFHSVAVTTGGRVFTWGMNTMGALGLGHTNNRGTPTQVTIPEMEYAMNQEEMKKSPNKMNDGSSGSSTSGSSSNNNSTTTLKRRSMSFGDRLQGDNG